jgi:high-affinity iron transporter
MLAIAIIVFREVLEAALIISIVLAASYGVPGRGRWVAGGVLGGVAGAGVVALFAATIADAFQGSGQEILNATVLLLAVVMLGWHNIWMSSHARALAGEAKALGEDVSSGRRPLAALAMITGAATLREGAETVLFVFGVATSSDESAGALVTGGVLGVAGGAALGVALYAGLLRIPVRRLFAVTGWMVLLLAGGLASQAASFLVQADILPPLGQQVWDTSFILSDGNVIGRILHTLVGYTARPQGIQVLAFVLTVAAIAIPARIMRRPSHQVPDNRRRRAAAPAVARP